MLVNVLIAAAFTLFLRHAVTVRKTFNLQVKTLASRKFDRLSEHPNSLLEVKQLVDIFMRIKTGTKTGTHKMCVPVTLKPPYPSGKRFTPRPLQNPLKES